LQDWSAVVITVEAESASAMIRPFLNSGFMTSLLFLAFMGLINYLNYSPEYPSPFIQENEFRKLVSFLLTSVFLLVLYFSFIIEISSYWNSLYNASIMEIKEPGQDNPFKYRNEDLLRFKSIWILNYSGFFLFLFSVLNIFKFKSIAWGHINFILNSALILMFLAAGLLFLSELRDSYLNQTLSRFYHRGVFNVVIRYVSFVFAALTLASIKLYSDRLLTQSRSLDQKIISDIIVYISLIWIFSSELLSWMDILRFTQSYKLALSILWGIYALFLIVIGIWKMKKHLRVMAIILFAVTLVKLFSYDLSHLNTVSKTIVFITLGILLLIISFLYNKYRNVITDVNN
jgi:hypothetical protein